ncbi:sodium-dependent transporter [Fulvivirgaceae bacterium BMA10]|uniref:Sodium-dependent transporter n=1 Tax=Splendidivirga corallicola TaxID=3051826 RepID=A0ABT8KWT5_9BACT|nr:sodium-dependent transporter [Fulvivirgaceae bacterium BMA10]
MSNKEHFSNRWGIILASLAMAIGAGNLWRFPRLAGQYGGTFIILWIAFLLIWSIPILLAEFSIGKKFKKGVIGSYAEMTGKNYAWIGFFITVCTLCITFYYSVVTAWALRYLGLSLSYAFSADNLGEKIATSPEYLETYWNSVSNGSSSTIILYVITIIVAIWLLSRGIQQGLEKASKILIPTLFVLLVIIATIALNMDGGIKGLEYMFSINTANFSNPRIWLEALSQSAWSTGAGWGLIMTISSYSRDKEDVTLNTFVGAFGNNTASLLAGFAILPSVFALSASSEEAITYLESGNQSLTFTVIPKLFADIPGGAWFSSIFFLALFFAAFSSLLPMIELFTKNLLDLQLSRKVSSIIVAVCCIGFGLPSAFYLDFFNNQDWVWGVGLIISGLAIIFAVLKHGAARFKETFIDRDSDFKVPSMYFVICITLNIFLGAILIYWWMSQDYSKSWFNEEGQWDVTGIYSNASTVTQWAIVILVGIVLNRFLYKNFAKNKL